MKTKNITAVSIAFIALVHTIAPAEAALAPSVTTQGAINVTSTSATLVAKINSNGASTTFIFQYGTTSNYGANTSSQTLTAAPAWLTLSGLQPNTTYHYRVVGTNTAGTAIGYDIGFTTLTSNAFPEQMLAPVPGTTLPPYNPTFNWTTESAEFYGLTLGSASGDADIYSSLGNVHPPLTVLAIPVDGRKIYARLGSQSVYQDYGFSRDYVYLATAYPFLNATTLAPINVGSSFATLKGIVNTVNSTYAAFQWGTTTNYGQFTPILIFPGDGSREVQSTLSSLTAGATYHYRMLAYDGTWSIGSDQSFMTPPETTAGPSQIYSPLPGVVFTSPSATFSWTATDNTGYYNLFLGSNAGNAFNSDIFVGQSNGTSLTVNNIPIDGRTIYVELQGYTSYGWLTTDEHYVYTARTLFSPGVSTNPATNVTRTSATINGTINPGGIMTSAIAFQYGRTTSYGTFRILGNVGGNTNQNLSASIGSLTPNTTYHYRLLGLNVSGFEIGADRTFRTHP